MTGSTIDWEKAYRDLRAAVEALVESTEWDGWGGEQRFKGRVRALLAPAPASETTRVERCPECRHVPHDRIGFCPNMASDNDCSCTYSAPTPPTTVQADRDAGYDCPHGHPLPENCGLCTGCDS